MTLSLSRPYTARDGAPVISRVDPRIFTLTYFRHCMNCDTCHDSCCQYGADIEMIRVKAIESLADELEPYLGVTRDWWFRTEPEDIGIHSDADYPGGLYTRTGIADLPPGRSAHNADACVFLDPQNRGCRLHRFALEREIEVHSIKPMVCMLFPVYFQEGLLFPAIEFDLNDLVCAGDGDSVYRGARDDLVWYFGEEFVAELDEYERQYTPQRPGIRLATVSAS
ncbi:hypothetical protein BH11PLA2_BH11PLA2_00180 [soil metagenome]